MRYALMRSGDLDELRVILGSSFAFPPAETDPWLAYAGHENVRVVRDGRRAAGCLLLIPMGQFLGGRSVPMVGIAGVGVALAERGRGVARFMMSAALRELAEQGTPISTLFPATQTLYRAVGYERAGALCEVTVPTHLFRAPRTNLAPRDLGPDDAPLTVELYTNVARNLHGYLDRGPYIWHRVRSARGTPTHAVGFFDRNGTLEAYVHFTQTRRDPANPFHEVVVKDAVAMSPRGYDAILGLLADQRSVGRETTLRGGPSLAILMRLSEAYVGQRVVEHWMLRITDVVGALGSRGYPRHVRTNLHVDVNDPLIAENRGRFVLSVEDGEARVRRGGKGTMRIDVRALAPLYTGYLSAAELARLGMLDASSSAVESADAIFRSPTPSMCEMF